MTISGITDAAALYKYVSRGGNAGGADFAETLREAEMSAKSDEEILAETLEEVYYNNKRRNSSEEKQEKKDFWEARTERQKLLDEYCELKETQRKAFEKLALKRKQERECFFNGEGVLFIHSAAQDVFGGSV